MSRTRCWLCASAIESDLAAVGHGTGNAITTIAATNPITVNTSSSHAFKSGQRVRLSVDPGYPKPGGGEGEEGVPPQTIFSVSSVDSSFGYIILAVSPAVTNIQGTHVELASTDVGWPGHGIVREIVHAEGPAFVLAGPAPEGMDNMMGTITARVTTIGSGGLEEQADGEVWALDGLDGVVANVTGSSFDVVGVSASAFDSFTEADAAALRVQRFLSDQDRESRAYVFTYVTEFGEEGPPSPPSNIIDTEKDGPAQVEIGDGAFNPDDGGSRSRVNRIRIYRTVAGETATLYLFVGTLNFTGGSEDDTVEWTQAPSAASADLAWSGTLLDTAESVDLGEPLPSEGWYPPPEMDAIVMMPNGILAGWSGNTLYFSEPYLPHAWDPDNYKTLDHDIVGAEVAGGIMVVGTRGRPYIVAGADPASMQDRRLPHHAPLMHPRAIADGGTGVLYVADNGLVWVNQGGAQVLTQTWSKETWLKVIGERDRLVFFDGYAFLYAPDVDPLVLSVVGDSVEAAHLDDDFSAACRVNNSLIIVRRHGAGAYRTAWRFNEDEGAEGPERMEALHRSGLVTVRRPCNFAVGQVLADGYPLTMIVRAIRPGSYSEPVEGQPDLSVLDEHEYTVVGPEPFRMGGGFVSRPYEIEILSTHRVQSVVVATSMDELRSQQ